MIIEDEKPIETDIAVIEEYNHGDWDVVAYIGPDRTGGELDIFQDYDFFVKLRVRYLKCI